MIRLKTQIQTYWDSASEEKKKEQGRILTQGFRDKLNNNPEFKKEFSEKISKIAKTPKNIVRMQELGRRNKDTENDRIGHIKKGKNIKALKLKRDRCSCVLCKKEIAINILISSHGDNKCNGDKSLSKDTTGNKGKYPRARASCVICRLETITGRLMVHFDKSSCFIQ